MSGRKRSKNQAKNEESVNAKVPRPNTVKTDQNAEVIFLSYRNIRILEQDINIHKQFINDHAKLYIFSLFILLR